MTADPLYVVARYALQNSETLSQNQRFELYCALGAVLPEQKDRLEAERIAWMIREATTLQTNFVEALFGPGKGDKQ